MLPLLLALLSCGDKPPADGRYALTTPDGRARSYLLHLPPQADGPLPVVLVFHGGGGDAAGARATLGLDDDADRLGFAVVYPEGTGERRLGHDFNTWNAGHCCGEAAATGVDDVGFVGALLDDLERRVRVDRGRVFATGISNGGAMSVALARARPDLLAGVAPAAAPGPVPAVAPAAPVPALFLHGTADACAPFDGGEACGGCWQRALGLALDREVPYEGAPCTGAPQQVEAWRVANRCGAEPAEVMAVGAARCGVYACEGAPLTSCAVEDGGHAWPGAPAGCEPGRRLCDAYLEVVGPLSPTPDASALVLEFFAALPPTTPALLP